jgi:hypothetical protein
MNKTAIKNFAIWARRKLIADVSYRAGLMGITENGIKNALPQSTGTTEFYDIGTAEPYSISGEEVQQRKRLVEVIRQKEADTDYKTAYQYIIEEVAYTWFNRLIAVRFMEVNEYLPSRIRVLSSETGKVEPDLVTTPFDADLPFTEREKQTVIQLKLNNQLDEVFRFLFIKQCNALNEILPKLFEKTNDYTELLLSISVIDEEGVVYHLVHDIPESNFNVEQEGQVEIIGWLYQYYNTEPKAAVFGRPSGSKIRKEEIPAATQLFTPDWIVRYMVENSLGRLWVEGHPNDELKSGWKYYLEEAEQEPEVQAQLEQIRSEYKNLNPKDIKVIDPCMGSGHILVYCFDVLMQIYEASGYSQRDAAQLILENNLYGLDIDDRAAQLAYFAVMMKARQYDRRIFSRGISPQVYAIQESNDINRRQLDYFGADLSELERNTAYNEMLGLLDTLTDAKEYGSILKVEDYDWELLNQFVSSESSDGQFSFDYMNIESTQEQLLYLVQIGQILAQKYDVVVTNPPYMGSSGMSAKLSEFVKKKYPDSKADLFAVFIERGNHMVKPNSYNCMVTMQSWMFLSSFEKMRTNILATKTITNLMHMENMVMGIAFGTAVTVFGNYHVQGYKGTYNHIKMQDIENGVPKEFPVAGNRFAQVGADNFSKIPGSPVAYWVSEAMFKVFENDSLSNHYDIKAGMCTGANAVFILNWQEVDYSKTYMYSPDGYLYTAHNKGGEYRKWYGNRELILKYNPKALKAMEANDGFRHDGKDYYFREHIGWSKITSGISSFRYFEEGFTFDSAGLGLFPNSKQNIYLTLSFLNSRVAQELIALLNPTLNVTPMVVKKLPFTDVTVTPKVESITKENIDICKQDWDSFETSWDFKRHPLVVAHIENSKYVKDNILTARNPDLISDCYIQWATDCNLRFQTLKRNEEELNRIFIDIYGLQDELTPEVEDKEVTVRKADLQRDIKSLLSYAVGCMFGRYSLDVDGLAYAGGEWDSSKYTTFLPDEDNVIPITDEEYFEDDIVGLFCAWLKKVYGAYTLEANLDFIASALGNKGSTSREIIRNYFLTDFFSDHCKTYQKRPIYWLFDSGKQNGFKALVYLHRYTSDSIGNLRVDYLHRMQRIYESEMNRMQDMIEHSTNAREVAAANKRKEKLQKQLKECREYDEKIGHLALSRIALDLDDGVKVNYEKVQTASDGKKYQVLAKI